MYLPRIRTGDLETIMKETDPLMNVLCNKGQGAKIGCFILACLFSIFWNCIHSHPVRWRFFSWRAIAGQLYMCPEVGHKYILLPRYRSPAKNARK